MTPLTAGSLTLLLMLAAWMLAVGAARRRDLPIGTLPLLALAAAPALAGAAALRGVLAPAGPAVIAFVTVGAIVDARTGSIFDPLTRTLAGLALAIAFAQGSMLAALGGAASTGGALLALHYLTGRRGIGLGDVKLATAIGAGAGAGVAAVAVAAAFVLGGAYGVWLLATRRAAHGTAVRFGPFLAAGTSLALLFPAGIR